MIVVIGKNGQLAKAIKNTNPDVLCLGREEIDVFDSQACTEKITALNPIGVINASAYTAVDLAESEPKNAFALNELAVKNIANAASKMNAHLVHVSTDYVFSGSKGSPYLPDDSHQPLNAYGASKAAGESILLSEFADCSCILRTSWVYSEYGNNFVKTMLRLMAEKPELQVIDDQVGSPTSAHTLAKTCLAAFNEKLTGAHHVTDEGVTTWYDFAMAIQELGLTLGMLEKQIPIKPVPTIAYPTPAKRPTYSVLSKASLKETIPYIALEHWRKPLLKVLQELNTPN